MNITATKAIAYDVFLMFWDSLGYDFDVERNGSEKKKRKAAA